MQSFMQATLYVVGRSDDNIIIKNLNPHLAKRNKRLVSCTYSRVCGTMNCLPKKQQVFFLKCMKVCSIFTSPSITISPKSYRDKQVSSQSELSLNSFYLELCHLNYLIVVFNSLLQNMYILFIFF